MTYVYYIITLYTLNLYSVVYQLYISKIGRKNILMLKMGVSYGM